MRKLLTTIFIFLLLIGANAQNWQTDFTKAKEIATEKNQNIILVFSGSDWCAPCIKLEKEIFSSEEFKAYAKDNYVMLKVDFPRKKQNKLSKEQKVKNAELADKYNSRGYFPLVLVLDATGNVLLKTDYRMVSPKEYIAILNSH